MQPLLVLGVRRETALIFGLMVGIRVSGIRFLPWPLTEASCISYEKQPDFLPDSLGWAPDVFERLQHITPRRRVEIIDFVVFSQLVCNLEACL